MSRTMLPTVLVVSLAACTSAYKFPDDGSGGRQGANPGGAKDHGDDARASDREGAGCAEAGCASEGAHRCNGAVVEMCGAESGCLAWREVQDCAALGMDCAETGAAASCGGGGHDVAAADAAPCADGVKDQDESDVDCGGASCPLCAVGKRCVEGADCQSGVCINGVCAAASCTDGLPDGDESDVDCGGSTCPPCAVGGRCTEDADCEGGSCQAGKCTLPACKNNWSRWPCHGLAEGTTTCCPPALQTCPDFEGCGCFASCF
jgi:hypothetical protein